MNTVFLVVVLALVWAGISGSFSGLNLLLGGVVGGVAVLVLREAFASPKALRRIRRVISLAALFLYELVVSAVRVAIVVMRPDLSSAVRPARLKYCCIRLSHNPRRRARCPRQPAHTLAARPPQAKPQRHSIRQQNGWA